MSCMTARAMRLGRSLGADWLRRVMGQSRAMPTVIAASSDRAAGRIASASCDPGAPAVQNAPTVASSR
ncbi:MAG: hypothetical protein HND58_06150 [Planctomycetota bacterium]|nr:MAG: hypothetical protein HND58_06150 [Planctomycetota bacterium]